MITPLEITQRIDLQVRSLLIDKKTLLQNKKLLNIKHLRRIKLPCGRESHSSGIN